MDNPPNHPPPPLCEALLHLQRCTTPEEAWLACLKVMRAAVPVCHVLLVLTSPRSLTPKYLRATLAPPELERVRQLSLRFGLCPSHPGSPVGRIEFHEPPYPSANGGFRDEFRLPPDWRYAVAIWLWSPERQFLGQLAAIRSPEQGDFTAAELSLFQGFQPQVEVVVQRVMALEERLAAHAGLVQLMEALPTPVILVSWTGQLEFSNPAAFEALTAWECRNGGPACATLPGRPLCHSKMFLPGCLQEACDTLKRRWEAGALAQEAVAQDWQISIVHPWRPGLRAEVKLTQSPGSHALPPSFAIIFHLPANDRSGANCTSPGRSSSKLTPAEREILHWIAEGKRNDEIATIRGLAVGTVKKHVERILDKLGVETRTAAARIYHDGKSGGG